MTAIREDIQAMTTFKRNTNGLVKRIRKTGRPLVLTVNGKAEVVMVDARAYKKIADQLDAVSSIRRGLVQARRGLVRDAGEVFDSIERDFAR